MSDRLAERLRWRAGDLRVVSGPLTAHLPGQHDQQDHTPGGVGKEEFKPEFTSKAVPPSQPYAEDDRNRDATAFVAKPGIAINDVAVRAQQKREIGAEITNNIRASLDTDPALKSWTDRVVKVMAGEDILTGDKFGYKYNLPTGGQIPIDPREPTSELLGKLQDMPDDDQRAVSQNHYPFPESPGDIQAGLQLAASQAVKDARSTFAERMTGGDRELVQDIAAQHGYKGEMSFVLAADPLWAKPEFAEHLAIAGNTRQMVDTWANTSSNENVHSLSLQMTAAKEFGVDASGIQPLLGESGATSPFAVSHSNIGQRVDSYMRDNAPFLGHFVREMYDNTQRQLREAGIDEVVLYRGMTWDEETEMPTWAIMEEGPTQVTLNPMSSWSADQQTARWDFAGTYNGVLLASAFPASRIISTARTGVGALHEYEYVVLGGPTETYVQPAVDDEFRELHQD